MTKFVLNMEEVEHLSPDELTRRVQKLRTAFSVQVACPNLDFPRSTLDIAYDYLKACLVGDALAPFCSKIEATIVLAPDHENLKGRLAHHVRFNLTLPKPEKLAQRLIELSIHFKDDPDMDEEVDAAGELDQYEHDLFQKGTRFPKLADSYLANSLNAGSDLGMEADDWRQLYFKHPERSYNFWKSFHSWTLGFDFYVSEAVWILPHDVSLPKALKAASGFKGKIDLLSAHRITVGQEVDVVQHKHGVYFFPGTAVEDARRCAHSLWVEPLMPLLQTGHFVTPDTPGAKHREVTLRTLQGDRLVETGVARALDEQNTIEEVLLSEEGTVLVVRDTIAQYVVFKLDPVGSLDIQNHLNTLGDALENLRIVGGEEGDFALPWHELSDEKFEDLCYDVIRCSERYDGDSVRKMGKTKSRDGGRDLLFEARQETFSSRPTTKWIGQCKLIGNGGSLTAKLQISDVIDQYGAGGYCVMTSGLIDATLHDKLKAIGENRGIATDQWDKMRLEKFLAHRTEIKKCYFKSSTS